jgi:predicted ester cyclase
MVNGKLNKREDVLAGLKWLTDIVPNYTWHIEDLFVDNGRIAARLRDTGPPVKIFFGAEPTGASIEFIEFASYKVRRDPFAEMWYLLDSASISAQLKQ